MESNGDPVGFKNGCIRQADGSVQEAQRYGKRTEAVEFAPNCDYTVPTEADMPTALQFLTLHIQTAHPKPPGPNPPDRPITKVELRSRPEVIMDTSEADWRFFLSEWKDYKGSLASQGRMSWMSSGLA